MTTRIRARSTSSRWRLLDAVLYENKAQTRTLDDRAVLARLIERLGVAIDAELWLALAVMTNQLPRHDEVIAWRRRVALEGPSALLALRPAALDARRSVEVVVGGVLVDAHHTSRTDLATGIQRVTRSVLDQWQRSRSVDIVRWRKGYRALTAMGGRHRHDLVVPWNSTYVLAELSVEPDRLDRLHALAEFSANTTCAIGFDCVPLTVPETAARGMRGAFARYLATVARFDRIAAISDAAAVEYRGWRRMLAAAGITGPSIRAVALAHDELALVSELDARSELNLSDEPIVLCVGSSEPRKNHLAVLHAAELAWRRGVVFQLVFVGGNAWSSDRFRHRVAELQDAGRAISNHERLSDEQVAALYRAAEVTLFPSLHEGFGLPVVESLSVGTPVITSNYGSMLASGDPGAEFVDPRDDRSIAEALVRILTDEAHRERLVRAAEGRSPRTWADYSDELWNYVVEARS
ncbi:MAG: glycosyltransferase family 4 protein [Microcella sp.]|uniref:glycosyltransferase family 4 protein n=1 Tax=Microcella sp. TaxID=1913979 RepID=UPI0024CA4C6E|nr:glycosyltransferase family 1 protein [Microcella sp.]UYN82593.1 MAG: glycosyltransferase family 4 protein [Microcella sp.]